MEVKKAASVVASGVPDALQLAKINEQAKKTLTAQEVYIFSVRLCDDQVDRDFERFSPQALQALAPMFIGKTGIADHAWSSEKQVARIFDTGIEYADGAMFIKAWAYVLRNEKNEAFIEEIEGGIKKEVSVGCSMGSSVCSICGAEYGSCEHHKGQSYGAEVCVAVLCDPIDAYEFSFVAVPAQRQSGVMKKLGSGGYEDSAELKQLKAEAELGRAYRKELEKDLVRLGLVLELGVEEGVLRRMAQALCAQDLSAMKQAWQKQANALFPPTQQLNMGKETAQETDSAFLI